MAYISGERTKEIKKELTQKFPNLKFSVRNRHLSLVDVTIVSGDIDFSDLYSDGRTYVTINQYILLRNDKKSSYGDHTPLLRQIFDIVDEGNYDNSDIMTDYFDKGFYVDMNIGSWDKPYVYKDAK